MDEYQTQLQNFLNTQYIEKAFINCFGKENQEQIVARLQDVEVICFQPDAKMKKTLIDDNNDYNVFFQTEFFMNFYEFLNVSIEEETLAKNIQDGNYQDYYFQSFFHSSFFSTFSMEEFKKSPIFSFDDWNYEEQEKFLCTFYPSYPNHVSHLILKKGILEVQKNLNFFQEILNCISRCQYTRKSLNLSSGKFRKLLFMPHHKFDIFKLYRVLYKKKIVGEAVYFYLKKYNYILISQFSSLNIVFHEIGHRVLENFLLEYSSHKNKRKIVKLKGIFLNHKINTLPMEVFHDYFILKCMKTLNSSFEFSWDFCISVDSYYSFFFWIVEPFLEIYESIFKFAMMQGMPNIVYEIVGKENFYDFLNLFHEYKEGYFDLELIKLKLNNILNAMKKHTLQYQANYYKEVEDYLKDLQTQGKNVRVLKPSMEKLQLEEKIIRQTIEDLS